jgi:hypothetical protein
MKSGEKYGATRVVGLIQAQALAVKANSLLQFSQFSREFFVRS